MVAGVPMIIWPLAHNDQALNAALLSMRKDPLAFEFVQIRVDTRPAMRGIEITGKKEDVAEEFRSTILRARGEEGDQMRENFRKMRRMLKEEERQEGNRQAIEAFAAG